MYGWLGFPTFPSPFKADAFSLSHRGGLQYGNVHVLGHYAIVNASKTLPQTF